MTIDRRSFLQLGALGSIAALFAPKELPDPEPEPEPLPYVTHTTNYHVGVDAAGAFSVGAVIFVAEHGYFRIVQVVDKNTLTVEPFRKRFEG